MLELDAAHNPAMRPFNRSSVTRLLHNRYNRKGNTPDDRSYATIATKQKKTKGVDLSNITHDRATDFTASGNNTQHELMHVNAIKTDLDAYECGSGTCLRGRESSYEQQA
jgi:hypothetical protein